MTLSVTTFLAVTLMIGAASAQTIIDGSAGNREGKGLFDGIGSLLGIGGAGQQQQQYGGFGSPGMMAPGGMYGSSLGINQASLYGQQAGMYPGGFGGPMPFGAQQQQPFPGMGFPGQQPVMAGAGGFPGGFDYHQSIATGGMMGGFPGQGGMMMPGGMPGYPPMQGGMFGQQGMYGGMPGGMMMSPYGQPGAGGPFGGGMMMRPPFVRSAGAGAESE